MFIDQIRQHAYDTSTASFLRMIYLHNFLFQICVMTDSLTYERDYLEGLLKEKYTDILLPIYSMVLYDWDRQLFPSLSTLTEVGLVNLTKTCVGDVSVGTNYDKTTLLFTRTPTKLRVVHMIPQPNIVYLDGVTRQFNRTNRITATNMLLHKERIREQVSLLEYDSRNMCITINTFDAEKEYIPNYLYTQKLPVLQGSITTLKALGL